MELQEYLTFENIYFWANFAVLPFWIMLAFIPKARITQILVNSIIAPLILTSIYVYVIYQMILMEELFFSIFKLYLSADELYALFSTESFLVIFWLHFIALNLFLGSWMANDATKYNIARFIIVISIILTYFTGPLGLVFYWVIRVFYAKRLSFHD